MIENRKAGWFESSHQKAVPVLFGLCLVGLTVLAFLPDLFGEQSGLAQIMVLVLGGDAILFCDRTQPSWLRLSKMFAWGLATFPALIPTLKSGDEMSRIIAYVVSCLLLFIFVYEGTRRARRSS